MEPGCEGGEGSEEVGTGAGALNQVGKHHRTNTAEVARHKAGKLSGGGLKAGTQSISRRILGKASIALTSRTSVDDQAGDGESGMLESFHSMMDRIQKPKKKPTEKKRSNTRLFDIGTKIAHIPLNKFSLTFQASEHEVFQDGGWCSYAMNRALGYCWTPLEMEFQHFYQDASLTALRRIALVGCLAMPSFLMAGFVEDFNSSQAVGIAEVVDWGVRTWLLFTAGMPLVCFIFLRLLYWKRSYLCQQFRLPIIGATAVLSLAVLHVLRSTFTPFEQVEYVFTLAYLYPFYLGLMAAGGAFTYPFYCVVSVIFTIVHMSCQYSLRPWFLQSYNATFISVVSDVSKRAVYDLDTDLEANIPQLWIHTMGQWIVFNALARSLEMRTRSHFIQLRRLNQLGAPKLKLVIDWAPENVKRLKRAFVGRLVTSLGTTATAMMGVDLPFEIEYQALVFGPQIGKGASGEVFSGFFARTPVAIKRLGISEETVMDPQAIIEEARGEAQILAQLRNEFVLQLHGVCADDQYLFLVTELCVSDLRVRIYNKEQPMPGEIVNRYLQEIAQGMAYLHAQGIAHRDLKPGNVLLDKNDKCKIADFGQSKSASMENISSEMTQNIGTPIFAAPEVHSDARRGSYSAKIDVYSFGVICWSLWTRERPYHELSKMNTFTLISKIVDGLRPTTPPNMPPRLMQLMEECWDGDAEKRPLFEEVVVRLQASNIMSGKPIMRSQFSGSVDQVLGRAGRAVSQPPMLVSIHDGQDSRRMSSMIELSSLANMDNPMTKARLSAADSENENGPVRLSDSENYSQDANVATGAGAEKDKQ
jgi:serine/threonine protein kinase